MKWKFTSVVIISVVDSLDSKGADLKCLLAIMRPNDGCWYIFSAWFKRVRMLTSLISHCLKLTFTVLIFLCTYCDKILNLNFTFHHKREVAVRLARSTEHTHPWLKVYKLLKVQILITRPFEYRHINSKAKLLYLYLATVITLYLHSFSRIW